MQTIKSYRSISYLLFLVCISFILSCRSDDNKDKHHQFGNKKNAYDVSLSDIEGNERYDVNDIFDTIRYIPLETTKESVFSQIDQMEVTSKYFFVLDRATKSVLAFEKNGKFRFKLESESINDLAIDEAAERIVIQDKLQRKVYTYDFNGQLVTTKTPGFNYTGLAYLTPNLIAHYRYFNAETDVDFAPSNILIADSNYKVKQALLQFDTNAVKNSDFASGFKMFYKSNDHTYFAQNGDYNVYYNLQNKVPDYFTINFPEKYSLPADYMDNKDYRGKRHAYITENQTQICLIENLYIINSLMSFEAVGGKWGDIFLYDLKRNKAISAYRLLSGPKNNGLPLGDAFLAADNKSFYRATTARQLFHPVQAQHTQKTFATLSQEMQTFYQTQNNLSNPVIVQLFPKKDLSGLKKKA